MFRWGIIFLVIALIAAALGLVVWPVPLQAQLNCLCRRDYSVPGEFVHGPNDPRFQTIKKILSKASPADWLLRF